MKYRSGYKYQLEDAETFALGWPVPAPIFTPYIAVFPDGTMQLSTGYAWNGANVIPDFLWIMRGSAGHDGGYQLIRLGLLDYYPWKDHFDRLLERSCIEDGAWKWQAALVYQGVHRFGASSASPANENPVLTAP